MKLRVETRVPVRIDFAGGGSDCPPYSTEHGGTTTNVAISWYLYASLESIPGDQIELCSLDTGISESHPVGQRLLYDQGLTLARAAINRLGIAQPLRLTTCAQVPQGTGLSTSAAYSVAILGALNALLTDPMSINEIAELAVALEREELGLWCGRQDQYGVAYGNLNYLVFNDPAITREPVAIDPIIRLELERSLVLCYTGQAHLSGNIHNEILASYRSGTGTTLASMHRLKALGTQCRDALEQDDLRTFAEILNENWQAHQGLHPSCNNADFQRFFDLGLEAGALGAKACGAGGGGCIVFFAPGLAHRRVIRALTEAGGLIMPFAFDEQGLVVRRNVEARQED